MAVSPFIQQSYPTSYENDDINLSQQTWQQSTTNKCIAKVKQLLSFKNYSSMAFVHSQYRDKNWKYVILFLFTESSIMFYSNVFSMICSIILMVASDKYISKLNVARIFLHSETNKPILLSLYSGFIMTSLCICGFYGGLTIRKKFCYWVSAVMMINAIFQFGIGKTLIHRKTNRIIMIKKKMKLSFLNYNNQSEVVQHWDEFQSEMLCCGLNGVNNYRAKQLQIPESCYKDKHSSGNWENDFHIGCFDVLEKIETFLNPVIILTFFCSFLQMTNVHLILNLLKPRPTPRRYHIACSRTLSLK